jgi:hypothetical protein
MGRYGLDLGGSGQGSVQGSCVHGIKPLSSIKSCEVIEKLSDW